MVEQVNVEAISTEERPPIPNTKLPPGYQWVWSKEKTDKSGKKTKGHWRKWPLHTKKGKDRKPRGPKPGQPRRTNPAHAAYVAARLDAPMAYLTGLLSSNPPGVEMIGRCIAAILDAQRFIDSFAYGLNLGRHTTTGEQDDDQTVNL